MEYLYAILYGKFQGVFTGNFDWILLSSCRWPTKLFPCFSQTETTLDVSSEEILHRKLVERIFEDWENQKEKLKSYRNCNCKKQHTSLGLGSVAVSLKPECHWNPPEGLVWTQIAGHTPGFLFHRSQPERGLENLHFSWAYPRKCWYCWSQDCVWEPWV